MNSQALNPITQADIDTYKKDGIVCLRGMFDSQWVDHLAALVDDNIRNPSEMTKNVNDKQSTGFFFYDTFVSHHLPGYQRFIKESPVADIVGQIMQSNKVNLLFDQVLAKEPQTSTRTTWHHDMPYWPVDGDQVCTVWIALDPVTHKTGAVEYIKGSHRWGEKYKAVSFNPAESYEEDLPDVPDIDAERDRYEFACFDMQPGDCTVHHALTVHGAPGNLSASTRRRAYIVRFTGDDAVYNPRPNLQKMKFDPSIEAGQPLDCALFPVIRPASS